VEEGEEDKVNEDAVEDAISEVDAMEEDVVVEEVVDGLAPKGVHVLDKSRTNLKLSATAPAPLPRMTSKWVFVVWLESKAYEVVKSLYGPTETCSVMGADAGVNLGTGVPSRGVGNVRARLTEDAATELRTCHQVRVYA
jgi:hypothetical protein